MSENMKIKILSGVYELVLSEQIIMDSLDSELVLDLVMGTYGGIMRIRFLKEEGVKMNINSHVNNNKELILECINFDERTAAGTVELASIGMIEGKKLKMHLWVTMLGNSKVRRVDINLYKEN